MKVMGPLNMLTGHINGALQLDHALRGLYRPELLPKTSEAAEDAVEIVPGFAFAPMTSLMSCLCILAVQYFAMYALTAVLRMTKDLGLSKHEEAGALEQTRYSAELTLNLTPMLCVLFLAAQMQALHISKGREDPPAWILLCMQAATAAVVAQTLLVMLTAAITRRPPEFDEDAGMLDSDSRLVQAASYLLVIILYIACGSLCVGILGMRDPEELVPGLDRVPPAISCTVNLALQFFVVHLCRIACRLIHKAVKTAGFVRKCFEVMQLATDTIFFAPMLCVLFIGARLRAMQVHHTGNPHEWAQAAFYICTYSVGLQTALAIIVPFLPYGDARAGSSLMDGTVEVVIKEIDTHPVMALLTLALQYVPTVLILGGFGTIVVSIYTMTDQSGHTQPVAPYMQCVLYLSLQFFSVYIGLWIAISIRNLIKGPGPPSGIVGTLFQAKATVHLSPMLAILFVALRMRSQQITNQTGKPQGWAQDAMYICTAAAFFQLVMCLGVGAATGKMPEMDTTGNARVDKDKHPVLSKIASVAQLVLIVALYGGACAVCVALWTITPETAGGHDALIPA